MREASYIFVYGSLMKGKENEMASFLLQHSEFIGNAYFRGKLYVVDWFPGAVKSSKSSNRVFGHVFKLYHEEFLFSVLDDYEGIGSTYRQPFLFKKERVPVFLENDIILNSWIYLYNRSVEYLKVIPSGKFSDWNPESN